MVHPLMVKPLEMAAVVRQDSTAKGVSAGQQVGIGRCLPAVFLRGQHVMTKPAQLLDHRLREVLVGVQLQPGSLHKSFFALLVLLDGVADFFRVGGGVRPGGF